MANQKKRTFVSIAISDEKKEIFKNKAESEGRSITDIILEMIDTYIASPSYVQKSQEIEELKLQVQHMQEVLERHNQKFQQYEQSLGEFAA
jgi:predicted DNA-binding protein